jgi:hypothetical protein
VLAALVAGPDGLFANDGESRRCLLAAARKQFNTTNGTKPCEAMLMPANSTKERHTHTEREISLSVRWAMLREQVRVKRTERGRH